MQRPGSAACKAAITHQGNGSEAAGAGDNLGGAQEEGQQQVDALQWGRVQLGRRPHQCERHRLQASNHSLLWSGGGQSVLLVSIHLLATPFTQPPGSADATHKTNSIAPSQLYTHE